MFFGKKMIKKTEYLKKDTIKYLVVHCSDTPNDQFIKAEDIHKMHLNFGWDGIGYHKIITRNGNIINGRPEYWIGAHVYGKNNISLGVCLIGKNRFEKCQMTSLREVLDNWKKEYVNSKVIGHRDLIDTKKTCPNFDASLWYYGNIND